MGYAYDHKEHTIVFSIEFRIEREQEREKKSHTPIYSLIPIH